MELLAEHVAALVLEAQEAGLSDETILAELQDAAAALHEGLSRPAASGAPPDLIQAGLF
jgi:hypothetical protein